MINKLTLPDRARLEQLLALIGKEARVLQDVRTRLFPGGKVTSEWLTDLDKRPQDADMVESFAARFGRMQDTLGDKLFPRFLASVGEQSGTMIDNLNRLERLRFVPSASNWLAIRALRNKLVHEYMDDAMAFAEALNAANRFVDELVGTFVAIERYLMEQ